MLNIVKIKCLLKEFLANQSAAVTVDFVVLTAGIVLLGAIATTILAPKVTVFVSAITL
ncbi:MAG: hypothetical protein IME92_00090 [Proteobacteria bacterium]|nr:hypothetical protein [Pseudomonadota bacterium]